MDEMEKITLYDENDNPMEYELIELFEYNDNVYGGFAPLLGEESDGMEEEVEVVMLKVVEKDGKEFFSEIESEKEEQEAFDELVRREMAMDEMEEE